MPITHHLEEFSKRGEEGRVEPKRGISKFLPRGTSTPKMIKIGEVRVLNHFDMSWTEPIHENYK